MRREAGDDVVQAVAVHVVGKHLRAASGREWHLVLLPNWITGEGRRLFPPAVLLHDVELAVAIHVTVAVAVVEPVPFAGRGNLVEGPLPGRLRPVWFGVAEIADHVGAFLHPRV